MKKFKWLACCGMASVMLVGISANAVDLSDIDKEALTYDGSVNYMQLMLDAVEDGSDEALLEGAVAEIRRNMKIDGMAFSETPTSFFEEYETFDEIAGALEEYSAVKYSVAASSLNYREGGSIDYGKIGELPRGTIVSTLEEKNGWYYVKSGSAEGWCDGAYLTLYDEEAAAQAAVSNASYTEDDLYWLAMAITKEAGCNWLSDTHQLLVGNVILNRMESSNYPDTIYDVLHQQGQYPWAAKGNYCDPSARAIENAQRLLDGERFCPSNVLYQSTAKQGSGVHTSIYDATLGNTTYFCYK